MMSMALRCISASLLGLAACLCTCAGQDLSKLSENVRNAILPDGSDPLAVATMKSIDAEVPVLLALLNASGLFPDINYFDSNDRSEWVAATHLQRCLLIATSVNSNMSTHYGVPTVAAAGQLCTGAWVQVDPQNTNWWWMSFGVNQLLSKLLILLPNATTLATVNAVFYPRLTIPDVIASPGANRQWATTIHVLIGVLNANSSHVDLAYDLMQEAYAPVRGEADGIQVDSSFHQHGPLAYFSYGYGAHFMANALTMESAARGTHWAMNASQWDSVSSYLLDGVRWATRGSEFNLGAMGRHNTYYRSVDNSGVTNGHYHFYAAYVHFSMAFPQWSPPFDSSLSVLYARQLPAFVAPGAYKRGNEIGDFYNAVMAAGTCGVDAGKPCPTSIVGHTHFWRSDYTVHARPGFSFALHMFSNRTLNSECVNDEGIQNRGMADGVLTTHVTGREYKDHPPVWRWSLLPGATQLQTNMAYACGNAQITDINQRMSFVGGVSDSWSGASCMDLKRIDDNSTLRSRKAWFFSEVGVVSLGAGIISDGVHNVVTTMDQRLLSGPVSYGTLAYPNQAIQVSADSVVQCNTTAWIFHDGVTYGLLNGAMDIGISTRTQNGSLAAITQGPATTISLPTFLTYIHHGSVQESSPVSYAYAIVPGAASAAEAPAAYKDLIVAATVVSNTASMQSVCWANPNSTTLWTVQAVWWPAPAQREGAGTGAPGVVCPTLTVSHPMLVMVSLTTANQLLVTVSSPEREQGLQSVSVTVAGVLAKGQACSARTGASTQVTVQLPTDDQTVGSSATVQCSV